MRMIFDEFIIRFKNGKKITDYCINSFKPKLIRFLKEKNAYEDFCDADYDYALSLFWDDKTRKMSKIDTMILVTLVYKIALYDYNIMFTHFNDIKYGSSIKIKSFDKEMFQMFNSLFLYRLQNHLFETSSFIKFSKLWEKINTLNC